MELEFRGEVFFWRGPAPWYFVAVPDEMSRDIEAISTFVSYGWGCIPVRAGVGATAWTTALIPKDGRYLVPLRADVRRAESLELADDVTVRLVVDR